MALIGEITRVRNTDNSADTLRYDKHKQIITGDFTLIRFRDKDTHQFIYFCPSLDITGYGETDAKAAEMLKFNVGELLTSIINLPSADVVKEIVKLGWEKSQYANKKFSKAYVDISGELKNFNADESTVERLQLVA